VLAGTTNLQQPLVVRVERAGGETRAAAIARLVERGAASRPALVAAADRIAFWLTWLVLATALGAGLYWQSLWVAVTVLVVTCPCALALAAPVAIAAAGGRLARGGVAMTRAGALEALARATDVVLDKTGTLTEGRVRIAAIHTLGAARLQACVALARGLEAASRHPLARAFGGEGPVAAVTDITEHAGQGIEGHAAGGRVRIGTLAFCRGLAGERAWAPGASGGTQVYLADARGFLAVFVIEDTLRAESAGAVRALRAAGLQVHLVSGDQRTVVDAAADALGIPLRSAEVSPEGKFAYVECLQRAGRVVAMIGDGLNDAPVLARADVSLAMGGGADSAQRQADFVLLGDSPAAAAGAFALSRRTMRIIRENFAWALAYNAVALPLAAAGAIGPWEAAVGMAASSFVVVLNAVRVDPRPRGPLPWKASTSSSLPPSRSYS
jgi:Cu2+-exporting ATPase